MSNLDEVERWKFSEVEIKCMENTGLIKFMHIHNLLCGQGIFEMHPSNYFGVMGSCSNSQLNS